MLETAELISLREDAERYRWLRDAPATFVGEPLRIWLWRRPFGAEKLDAAIDAARAALSQEVKP